MSARDSPGRRLLRALAASVWRFKGRVLAAVVLLVAAKLSVVAVPLALKAIIDSLGRPEDVPVLPVFLLLAYALLRFSGTLFGELRDLVFSRAAQRTVADFSSRAFSHLLSLSPRFHAQRQTGRLTRDVERGTAGIGFLLGVALFAIVPTFVEIGAVVSIMVASYSLWFTAIIAATFLAYTFFSVIFTGRRSVHQRAVNELDSTASSRVVDSLLNYDVVKAFANEKFEAGRFTAIMGEWVETGVRNQRALFTLHVGQSAIIAVGVALVMLLAGQGVVGGAMTVGDLVLINAYVIQICLPLNALGFVFRQTKDAMVNAEKLAELMDERPDMKDTGRPIVPRAGEVVFDRVEFGYEPNRTVLRDVSFRIPPGGTVAVVGGSGSGKSTLARLLLRFYDVTAGSIRIDGQDLREVSPESVRAAVGIVPQDTVLFNQSIAYNIAYGRPGASPAEVVEAARAAQIHDFIAALPGQYDTVVGERGVKLSGGEKQRIAIARVLLKNPAILVFDEATSALDPRAERAIQAQLDRIAENRTTLVIAHRMSTIVHAGEILVMEHGRIVERGTHAQLLAQAGVYAQMWALQQQESELRRTAGRLALEVVNLAALAARVIEDLRPEIDARGVSLYALVASRTALRVTGDHGLLQELMWKLMSHAVSASERGGRVGMDLERNGGNVLFRVTHGGPPLADGADARAIAEQHGGTFGMEQSGGVQAYVVELPLRAVDATARGQAAGASGGAADPVRLRGARILVVDDQEEARLLLREVLSARDARVETLASGGEALQWFSRRDPSAWPDLFLCDIGLPDASGYDVMREIRALESERSRGAEGVRRTPAIALTGFASSEDRTEALLAGFQMHLGKPVDVDELLAASASLVGSRRRREDVAAARAGDDRAT